MSRLMQMSAGMPPAWNNKKKTRQAVTPAGSIFLFIFSDFLSVIQADPASTGFQLTPTFDRTFA